MSDTLRLVARPATNWRTAMYTEYIVEIRARLVKEQNPEKQRRDEALLKGWLDLRAELEAELAQPAREERRAVRIGA